MAPLPLLHFFCMVVYLAMAAFVLIRNAAAWVNRFCALVLACFALWCLGKIVIHHPETPVSLALFFQDIVIVGAWGFSGFLLLFALALTERDALLERVWLYPAVFGLPLTAILMQWTRASVVAYVPRDYGWGLAWRPTLLTGLTLGYIFLGTVAAAVLALCYSRRTKDATKRKGARLIAGSILVGILLGFGTNVIGPNLVAVDLPDLGQNLGIFWTAGLVYAITRYRLLDISPATAAEQILETMSDALLLADTGGRIVDINRSGQALCGYPIGALRGRHIGRLIRRADHQPIDTTRAGAAPQIGAQEGWLQHCDGELIAISFSTSIMSGADHPGHYRG